MKRAAVLFFIFSFFASTKAQHCPFDGLGILVVSIIDSETGEIIDDVSISLVDNRGNALTDWRKEGLVFVKNPARTDPYWTHDDFKTIRYSFADTNFILPISLGFADKKVQIKVESNTQKFKPTYYRVDSSDYFALHDNIGDWTELRNLSESPKVEFDKLISIEVDR